MPVSGAWTYTTVSVTECRIDDYSTASGYTVTIPTVLDTYSVVEVYIDALKNKDLSSLEIVHSVELEDNCFSDNGTISVSIDADVTTDTSTVNPPFENCSIGENLTIGNNVTTIADHLFLDAGITGTLSLTSAVTTISNYAFRDNSITNLTFDYPLNLDGSCFMNNGTISVTINEDITTIGAGTPTPPFDNCEIGENLTIGDNVTIFNDYIFMDAGITGTLSFSSAVTSISNYAFSYNSITNLIFSYAINLDYNCFSSNGSVAVTINENVTTVGASPTLAPPFNNCTIGENLIIGNNVTTIATGLFSLGGVTSVTFPASVTSINNYAFYNCDDLAYFKVVNNSVTFGTNILDGNMSADNKGIVYGDNNSNTYTWWFANYTSTYNFRNPLNLLGIGQYVKIYLNSELKFTGIVSNSSYKKEQEAVNTIFQDVNCATLNVIPAKRTIELDYDSETTASTIVNDMINNYLSQDGIEAGEISQGIVFENEWRSELTNIAEVLDECANRSGFQWYIDKDMKLNFYKNPTTISACTYTIEDNGSFKDFREVSINESLNNYVNKVFVSGGNDNHGDLIYTVNGSLSEQNNIQEINCGTGIHGYVHRDTGIVEHDYKYIESGSSPTQINFTNHPMSVGDFFWNLTRNAYSFVTSISANSFGCESVASQASSDEIEYYVEVNDIGRNQLEKKIIIPQIITLKSYSLEFEPQTKLTVSISDMSVSGQFNIDEVNIQDRGSNYFVATVKAIKRVQGNFNTQKNDAYTEYFKDY